MKKLIYLFTGQPGSGKTTIGKILFEHLNRNNNTIQIDGDDLREIFKNVDYSRTGRESNISKSHDIAYFLYKKEFDVVITMVSPYKKLRDELKNKTDLIEIYMHTSNIRGKENYFAKDYEKPTENYIDLDTTDVSIDETFKILLDTLNKK